MPGTLADGLEALEDGDVLGAVASRCPVEPVLLLRAACRPYQPCLPVPPLPSKSPDSATPVGRAGALHKTALDTSRLPPVPDGSASYKMPANRDKMAARATRLSDGSGAEPTTKRRRSTDPLAGAPRAALEAGRGGPAPSSSSSCAQTPDSQATVTTPSRSETGAAAAAQPAALRRPDLREQGAGHWTTRERGRWPGVALGRPRAATTRHGRTSGARRPARLSRGRRRGTAAAGHLRPLHADQLAPSRRRPARGRARSS